MSAHTWRTGPGGITGYPGVFFTSQAVMNAVR
jgi:hypothetical protein